MGVSTLYVDVLAHTPSFFTISLLLIEQRPPMSPGIICHIGRRAFDHHRFWILASLILGLC
jgi:hypothetical protein